MLMQNMVHTLRLFLLHLEYVKLDSAWNYEHVISPFSRIYLITKGKAWICHSRRRFCLCPDRLYLVPAFTPSRYYCKDYMEQYFVHFTDEMDGGFSIFELFHFNYETAALDGDGHLFRRLLKINADKKLFNHDPKVYDNKPELFGPELKKNIQPVPHVLETEGILLQLFSRFMGAYRLQTMASFRRMNHVVQFIKNNLANPITLDMLSEEACLNPDYFSRTFKIITGFRPIDYINRKRIERAQLLMMVSGKSLHEICEQVGIHSMPYFNRLFRKYADMSPGKYRRQLLDHS